MNFTKEQYELMGFSSKLWTSGKKENGKLLTQLTTKILHASKQTAQPFLKNLTGYFITESQLRFPNIKAKKDRKRNQVRNNVTRHKKIYFALINKGQSFRNNHASRDKTKADTQITMALFDIDRIAGGPSTSQQQMPPNLTSAPRVLNASSHRGATSGHKSSTLRPNKQR